MKAAMWKGSLAEAGMSSLNLLVLVDAVFAIQPSFARI